MSPLDVATLASLAGLAAGYHRYTVTRLRRQLSAARRRATHDPLTGLLNRAGLTQAWPMVPPDATVALVDLDGFKPVNDRHGHTSGDHVLAVVAARVARAATLAARLGGDEFVLVFTGPNPFHAALAVDAHIAVPIALPSGPSVWVTASIGLAPTGTRDLSTALGLADAAMYRAKTTGTAVAAYDPYRDDRTTPTRDPRPAVRVRDLPTSHRTVEVTR